MTDPTQPGQPNGPTPPPWAGQPGLGSTPAGGPKHRSWFARHKILTALGAVLGLFVVLGGIGAAIGDTDSGNKKPIAEASQDTVLDPSYTPPSSAPPAPEVTDTAQPTTAAPTTTRAEPKPPAEPELTAGQKQALRAAEDYLEFSAFSRLGLIGQLSSDYGSGFSKADATFAVDRLKVDWNEQAVRSAKEYLSTQPFSRKGLIQQLSSSAGSQFTVAQATHAADKVGL